MEVLCTGTAEIQDNSSGKVHFIEADELEWETLSGPERGMGSQTLYAGTVEHDVLGQLRWEISEYPEGSSGTQESPKGEFKIIKDFSLELVHSESYDLAPETDKPDAHVSQIVDWFREHYRDPAHEMPYNSKDGYSYPWGGPYDASEEIYDNFGDKFSEAVLEAAVELVEAEGTLEWAPSGAHPDQLAVALDYEESERLRKEDIPRVVNCEICNTQAESVPANGDYLIRDCPRCGEYKMSGSAAAIWQSSKNPLSVAKLSGWVHRENLGATLPNITSNTIRELSAFKLPDIGQRADLLLLEAARGQKTLGEIFNINDDRFISASFSQDKNEVQTLSRILDDRGQLKAVAIGGRTEIQPNAYEHIEQLKASDELGPYLKPQTTIDIESKSSPSEESEGTKPKTQSSGETSAINGQREGDAADISTDTEGASLAFATTFADSVNPEDQDHLLVENEANAFARLIASKEAQTPLSIGIFGRWGSGKSFFLDRISQGLKSFKKSEQADFHQKVVQVEFNAWHYMETNVWASLVDVIFKALDSQYQSSNPNTPTNLFDTLVTAQELKLDAIEKMAASLTKVHDAQQGLVASQKKMEEEGPSGKRLCETIVKKVTQKDTKTLERAAKAIGFDSDHAKQLEGFRLFISEFERLRKEGSLFSKNLKLQFTNPWWLGALGVCLVVAPILLSQVFGFFQNLGISNTIGFVGSSVALVCAWLTRACAATQTAVKTLGSFNSLFEGAKTEALAEGGEKYQQAVLAFEHAKDMLMAAEQRASNAHKQLIEETPGGRLAAFISERAGSGEYSDKLGIIATIRKDFEQLSLLMTDDKDEEKTLERLNNLRELSVQRVNSIRSSYEKLWNLPTENLNNEAEQLSEALDQALENLETSPVEPAFTRIVLKIDDLDRCPAAKVAEVLQAIHLFLNFPLFVVVVCVDERWLSASLKSEFKDLLSDGSGAGPSDYLEKIFQIPYWTRALTATTSTSFAEAILNRNPPSAADPNAGRASPPKPTPSVDASTSSRNQLGEEQGPELHTNGTETPEQQADDPAVSKPADARDLQTESKAELHDGLALFQRLSLSAREKKNLASIAIIAGDTPRRTLRFVNVYLLIKSTFSQRENAEFDKTHPNNFRPEALAILVAICTRGDVFSRKFLKALNSSLDNHTAFKTLLTFLADESKKETPDIPVSELKLLTEKWLTAFNTRDGAEVSFALLDSLTSSDGSLSLNHALGAPENRKLLESAELAIVEMSEFAQRYTFMAAPEIEFQPDEAHEGT